VNFRGTSIPNSSSTSSATALTLSWDGDADSHTSTFAGGLTLAGTMACTNLICTGIATMPASSASVGQVLKMSRTEISNGNNFIATNGSKTQIWSHAYTPTSASSYLLIDFVGTWTISAPSGSDDGQWKISLEVNNATIGSTLFKCLGSRESGSTSPVWGSYTNSSIAAKNIFLYGQQPHSADQGLF
jgi:hypothetical protein